VPILGDMKAEKRQETPQCSTVAFVSDGELVANWTSGALCGSRSARKAMSPPDRRQAAPMKLMRGSSSDGV
jgi:hypothetical protein